MSLTKCVSSVKTLNGYASFTDDLSRQDYKVPFNIGTILSLKKICSFEIDYFTKYKENGAAFVLLKRLLQNPASKTWGLLGKEIASLLQYWLEGVKKYLTVYCPQWWLFLKSLLEFVNDLILKDLSIANTLVKSSSESLLELACIKTLNVNQQLQLVASLGNISAAASKELLLGLQKQYIVYFTKLGQLFLTREAALQYSVLELFISWGVRPALPSPAAEILAEKRFTDFYKDSRELLNALNSSVEDITSIPCLNVTLGDVDIAASPELWLDISSQYGRLSIILPPPAHGLLLVTEHAVSSVTLQRDAQKQLISIALLEAPYIVRGHIEGVSKNPGQILKINFSMEYTMKIDKALKTAFNDKYEYQQNIGDESFSKGTPKVTATSQDISKWSRPPKKIGYDLKVRGLTGAGFKSPSTASTTSLAQLHEKLAAFPRLRSDREFPTVCAQPDLSMVTEISEYDYEDRKQGIVTKKRYRKAITSPSDEEIGKERKFLSSPNRCLYRSRSPSPNSLLSATIGPLDKTDPEKNKIIDQILKEAFQKDVLLDSGINTDKNSSQVPESEPIGPKNVKNVTVISKSSSEEQTLTVIEDSKVEHSNISDKASKKEAYKSSTTDESNTEAINDTPHCYVSTRRKPKAVERNFKEIGDLQPVAVDDVLEFFEQHFNTTEDLPISPTLARKINASSDSSESFDQIINESQKMNELQADDYLNLNDDANIPFDDVNRNGDVANSSQHEINFQENTSFEVDENDVLGCLVSMIDKVCEHLDKCADMTDQEVINQIIEAEKTPVKKDKAAPKKAKMPKIKLVFKKTAAKKTKKPVKKNKLELESADKEKSPETAKYAEKIEDKNMEVDKPYPDIQEVEGIREQVPKIDEITEPKRKTNDTTIVDPNTPFMVRRKRKLYSPNDDNDIQVLETTDISDKPESKIKTTATSYKDIERDRKIFRTSRSRKSSAEPKSPRTLKNDSIFESLKENIDNQKDIVLVDVVKKTRNKNMAVYNFSSDDDSDDAFKPPVRKSASLDTKNKRKVKHQINKVNSEEIKTEKEPKKERKKRAKKTLVAKAKTLAKNKKSLEDERMRKENTEVLEQSFIIEEQQEVIETPKKVTRRSMEAIPADDPDVIENTAERNVKILKIKKEKGLRKQNIQEQKRKPKSPEEELPPLIIEEIAKDGRSSTSSSFAKKIQKIMRDGCIDETNTTHDLLDGDKPSSPEIQTEIQIINNETNLNDTQKRKEKYRNNIQDLQFIEDEKENIQTRMKTTKSSQKTKEIQLSDNDHEYEDSNTNKNKKSQKGKDEIDLTDNNETKNKYKKLSRKTKDTNVEKDSNKQKTKVEKCLQIETVDIASCDQSERSISTCHGNSPITAHGDMDEAPPSPKLLNEVYSPRNLGIQKYAKEYKQQLRKVIRYCSSGSKQSEQTQKLASSPVVSIKRMSLDDIRKKMKKPKERHDSCDSKSSHNSKESQKSVPKSLSPLVSVKRMSPDDIRKWLPSPKSSTTGDAEVEIINFNSKKRVEKGIVERDAEIREARKIAKRDKNEKTIINDAKVDSIEKSSSESLASPTFKGTVRKSIISPITDFGEYLQVFIGEELTTFSERSKSNITLKPRGFKRQDSSNTEASESSKRTLVMKRLSQMNENPKKIRKIDCSSFEISQKSDDIPSKIRKVASPSSVSTARVRQWLERADSSKQNEDKHEMCEDCIKYVIEKIDTTLLEIHQETDESWMKFLVEQEATHRKMIKKMVAKMNEMYDELSAETRARAAAVLGRDCSRKRALLAELVSALNDIKRS